MRGTYLYRPMNRGRHPDEAATRAPAYLADWLDAFPDSTPSPSVDFEDWAENAVLLHEARRRDLPLTILDPGGVGFVSSSAMDAPISDDDAPAGAMLGTWTHEDFVRGLPVPVRLVGQDGRSARLASNYAESPVFLRHAGRRAVFADATRESVEAALATILGERDEARVFVKSVRKAFAGAFALRAGPDGFRQLCDAFDGLEWDFVQYEGAARLLLIQDAVAMGHEYRFFVVDGEVVTGAGCVENHTPLDGTQRFDAKMEPIRNRSMVGAFPDVARQHLAFARRFVAEFAAEHGPGLDYCLDVATTDDGSTIAIELNPPLNCGRYASDVGAWMDAIVARTEAAASPAAAD